MRTRAARDGDYYVLTGAKTFVSDAAVDPLVSYVCLHPSFGTMGSTASMWIVTRPGPAFPKHIDKVGLRTPPTDLR